MEDKVEKQQVQAPPAENEAVPEMVMEEHKEPEKIAEPKAKDLEAMELDDDALPKEKLQKLLPQVPSMEAPLNEGDVPQK